MKCYSASSRIMALKLEKLVNNNKDYSKKIGVKVVRNEKKGNNR